jgi:hypothetical protein
MLAVVPTRPIPCAAGKKLIIAAGLRLVHKYLHTYSGMLLSFSILRRL